MPGRAPIFPTHAMDRRRSLVSMSGVHVAKRTLRNPESEQRSQSRRDRHCGDEADRADEHRHDRSRYRLQVYGVDRGRRSDREDEQDRREAPTYARASVLTVAAMWSCPTSSASRTSRPNTKAGFARRNAITVDDWLTVRSSSAPSAPITMPARSRPWIERSPAAARIKTDSSDPKPVRCARS